MAEENIVLPTTPNQAKSDGVGVNWRRNSLGYPTSPYSTKSDGTNRRNSIGNRSSSNNGGDTIPHYLRASTGSCHDFCKYGKKHASESKSRPPIRKKITPQSGGQIQVEILVMTERKKTLPAKLQPSLNSKTTLPESTEIIKREVLSSSKKATKLQPSLNSRTAVPDSPEIIKREVSLSSKKAEQGSSNAKDKDLSAKLTASLKLKTATPKPTFPDPARGSSSRKLNDSKKEKESNLLAKHAPTMLKQKPVRVKLASSSSSNPSGGSSDLNTVKNSNLLTKLVTSLKPKPSAVKPSPPSNLSDGLSRRKNRDVKIVKRTGVSLKNSTQTALSSPRPSLSRVGSFKARKSRSVKIASSPKKQSRLKRAEPSNDNVEEKILYVIKTEPKMKETPVSAKNVGPTVQSSPSSSPKSPSGLNSLSSSFCEEDDEEEYEYTVSEENDSMAQGGEFKRKPRMVDSEMELTCGKLNFIRGTVVDLQVEKDGPRKLRFRRGRVLGENPNVNGETRRRSFKNGDSDGERNGHTGSEKVVLRHQDVQGKKDGQGLLNNVIEETASKLVESRKSKVKALVGAFETVISLQESRPVSS